MAEYTFIEVCAGAGGLGLGFLEAGFTPILVNEIDKNCCKTLRENHPDMHIVEQDMQSLDLDQYAGKVDALIGGVPCQSFSVLGRKKGLDDPRGQLILQFGELIRICKPKIFMIENVKGLVTHMKGKTFASVIDLLKKDGDYNVVYKVLNAKDFGVPQSRERVFIVGVRIDIQKSFIFPTPLQDKICLRDVLTNVPYSKGILYSPKMRLLMELIPEGGNWCDLPEDKQRLCVTEKYIKSGGCNGICKRLSMDGICPTLTTSPNTKLTGRGHPTENRPLTIREYARIQTFPDTYSFVGGVGSQYKQIGNAVPVKLAYAMATQIMELISQK